MVVKCKKLIGLTIAILLTAGVAQAKDEKDKIVDQNLSKRPFQESPTDVSTNKNDYWDGATLVTEDVGEVKAGPSKHQQLRIRMLGQRPYMQKSTD